MKSSKLAASAQVLLVLGYSVERHAHLADGAGASFDAQKAWFTFHTRASDDLFPSSPSFRTNAGRAKQDALDERQKQEWVSRKHLFQ